LTTDLCGAQVKKTSPMATEVLNVNKQYSSLHLS